MLRRTLCLLLGLWTEAARAEPLFGTDDRRPLTANEAAAARAIGLIRADGAAAGTGTLILRPDLMLTAAHVLFEQGEPRAQHFTLTLDDGATARLVRFWSVTLSPETADPGEDWVLAELDHPLPAVPLQPATPARRAARDALLIGLNGDPPDWAVKRATPCTLTAAQEAVLPAGRDPRLVLHDCDTRPGASGAPLLTVEAGRFTVLALHSGQLTRGRPPDGTPFDPGVSFGIAVRLDGTLRAALAHLARARIPH